MIWSAQRLIQSLKLTPKVVTSIAVVLLPLSLLLWLTEYGVSMVHQSRFSSPADSSVLYIILVGLGAFILESLVTVSWVILVAHATERILSGKQGNSFGFLFKHFHQTLIEYIRALISVGLYTLILIIPGLIRWVQLSFTCYVSLFNEKYHQGQVDALERSKEIVRSHGLSLFFLILIFALIPTGLEKIAWSIGGGFLAVGAFYLLSWLTTILLSVYITLTYFALAKSKMT